MSRLEGKDFEEIWYPVKSVIEFMNMDYEQAVTIGGQFGKLESEIKRLQNRVEELEEENKRYKQAIEKTLSDMSGYDSFRYGDVLEQALEADKS